MSIIDSVIDQGRDKGSRLATEEEKNKYETRNKQTIG